MDNIALAYEPAHRMELKFGYKAQPMLKFSNLEQPKI